jgi:hypothetical protein
LYNWVKIVPTPEVAPVFIPLFILTNARNSPDVSRDLFASHLK